MARKAKPVDRRLEVANQKAAALAEASVAQQAEIEQLRAAVAELTAPKPGRRFRARTIYHGALDVKLRGELAEDEVWIEHVGETLVILVGAAATAARDGRTLGARARSVHRAAPATEEDLQEPDQARPPSFDLQEHALSSVGVAMPSIAASSPFGDISAQLVMEDGRVVTNAALGPQRSARAPGGYQDRSEAAVIAAREYGGYSGHGPKPAGWVDPDLEGATGAPSN